MKKQSFLVGALILVFASFINRIIGFIYRVLVVRIVGAEGIGLYEIVFPVYIMILVLATAGIPLAISKLVSDRVAKNDLPGAYKIFRIALSFLFFSGLFFSIALYLILPILMEFAFSDPRVNLIFKTMIPAIFFISMSSAFRGYFQGLQQMLPTAFTQTIEQVVRVFFGLYLAKYLLQYGLEYGVTGLAIGMVMGEMVGLLVMIAIYKYKRVRNTSFAQSSNLSSIAILKEIFALAIPITLTRAFATIVLAIEAIMLPHRLQVTGLTIRETTTIYGQYSGMAFPLLVLPTILTISLAITLVPAISEASAQKNYYAISSRIHKSLKLTVLVGIPCSIIFYFWGTELTVLLFDNLDAGNILKVLSFGGVFLYLQQTTTGILQGLAKVNTILFNSLVAGLIRLVGIYYLAALPSYRIYGALIAVNISFVAMSFLNILSIAKETGLRLEAKKHLIKPCWSGLLLIIFIKFIALKLLFFDHNILQLISIIVLSLTFYLISLIVNKVVKLKDFYALLNKSWRQ